MADPSPATATPTIGSWMAYLRAHPGPATCALLSFGAAGIHFAVSPDHFGEWVPYGIAFACLAWFQLLWGAAYLVRPDPRWGQAAVIVNLAVLVVWAWSRTVGLPVGPSPGSTEPVGFADSLSSGLEAVLVLMLLAPGTRVGARAASQPARWASTVALLTVLVFIATVVALAALAPQPSAMG